MDFSERLKKAVDRGAQSKAQAEQQAASKALTEEEIKSEHSRIRLELSEYIESHLKQVIDHFPGFEFQSLYGDDGWGGRISRDDTLIQPGKSRGRYYSRLELAIRPYSTGQIVELTSKATVGNKELFVRQHFRRLMEYEEQPFKEMIDLWVVEFAEAYSKNR